MAGHPESSLEGLYPICRDPFTVYKTGLCAWGTHLHVPKESSHEVESWELILPAEDTTLGHPLSLRSVMPHLKILQGFLGVFAIRSSLIWCYCACPKSFFIMFTWVPRSLARMDFPLTLQGDLFALTFFDLCGFTFLWNSLSLFVPAGLFSSKPVLTLKTFRLESSVSQL